MAVNTKYEITQRVIANLPHNDRPTTEDALHSWWMNFRDGGGMRLTQAGFLALSTCDFETHTFDMPAEILRTARHLLTLDRKLDCPYYIELGRRPQTQITLFGSQQAMMLALYNDLEKWLNFLNHQ